MTKLHFRLETIGSVLVIFHLVVLAKALEVRIIVSQWDFTFVLFQRKGMSPKYLLGFRQLHSYQMLFCCYKYVHLLMLKHFSEVRKPSL